jgi:hypothetical protein
MATNGSKGKIDFEAIKRAASGRWDSIIPALTALPADVLTKKSTDHPCPQCNGASVIWPSSDALTTGSIACRKCTDNKPTGDGIATVAAFTGQSQLEAAKAIASHLGIDCEQADMPKRDLIAEVCRDKKMPVAAFMQFNPKIEKRGRGRNEVVRVPVYNERGETHSHFDFAVGHKGWCARGDGMSGMFFPGRLPKPGETWHIVEGCKDAAALIGLGFDACGLPTSVMGEKYARLFAGVDVVLVPDLDTAGQSGSQLTGGRLAGIAASVRVARLPGEIVEKGGDDVRDVLSRQDGAQLVRDAIAKSQPWTPREGEHDPKDGRPEVLITLAYGWCVDQVCTHLGKLGWETPWIPKAKQERLKLYQRGGVLVQVVTEDTAETLDSGVEIPAGSQRIRPLPMGQLPLRIADACQLIQEVEKDGEIERIAVPPQKWCIDGVFTKGDYGRDVRRLAGIITAPTLRPDGTILQTPGWDSRTGLLYQPCDSFPKIPDKPTREDASKAAGELLHVIKDFEFVSDADKSAWLALVLSLLGRAAITGCVPCAAISATCRGSGKTLLADAASLIAFGRSTAKKPYTDDDNEQRKAITAIAMEALPCVLLDNVDRGLGGASLDAALTATEWRERILCTSTTTGELPMRTVWMATGNNLRYITDFARRVVPIRLAPTVENPEERTGFEHSDLLGWVRENRPRLAVAALTILRAYFVAGRPEQPGGQFGSFESWASLIRGSVVWAGLSDPLTTRETAKADDTSNAVVRGLIGGLLEVDEHGDGMTAKEIVDKLFEANMEDRFPAMREVVSEVATYKGRVDARSLSYAMRKYRGRIANGFLIFGEPRHGGIVKWMAKPAKNGGDGGDGGDVSSASASKTCVSHTYTHTHDATHTHPYGNGAEISTLSQPSPPSYGSEVEI